MTVWGDKSPWAVENDGSVSQLASTELDNEIADRLLFLFKWTGVDPWVVSNFCAAMGGVWVVGDPAPGGMYMDMDLVAANIAVDTLDLGLTENAVPSDVNEANSRVTK